MRTTTLLSLKICMLLPSLALADPSARVHVVKQGDTLWNIAGQYMQNTMSWSQIQKLNALGTPQNLQVGTELNIPMQGSAFPVNVSYVRGQAWLIIPGQLERPLVQGMKLDAGQSIRTGEASSVSLGFGDGVNTVLPSDSYCTLDQAQKHGAPQLMLQRGEAESYVPKRGMPYNSFEVITPQGVLGVRGTHFRVRIDSPQSSQVEVLNGRVVATSTQVTKRSETSINAKQGLALNEQGVMQVRELLPATGGAEQAQTSTDNPDWKIRIQPVPAAVEYLAQLSRGTDFLAIDQDQRSPVPEFTFKGLMDGFYYVRIVAIDSYGLRGEPAEFMLLHRAANGRVYVQQDGPAAIFNWAAASMPPGQQYRLKISTNEDLSSPIIDQRGIQSAIVSVKDLPPGLLYWQVITDDEQHASTLGSGTLH